MRTCDDGVAAECELAQRLPVRQRVLREAVHEHHHRLGRAIRQHQVNSKISTAFWPRDGNLAPRRRPAELALLLRGASKCGRRCWSDVRVGRAGKGERPQNSSSANRTSKSGHRKRPLRRRSPLEIITGELPMGSIIFISLALIFLSRNLFVISGVFWGVM